MLVDYRYDEFQYAKNILENGFQSPQHLPTELRLVATYMRRVLGYKPKQLREEFYKWCESNISGYNRVLYYKTINRAINKATKKGSCLTKISDVKIYQPEIDYIMNSNIVDSNENEYEYSYDCKKLMFTFLVRSKLNKQLFEQKNVQEDKEYKGVSFSGGQKKYTELKKMAKLPQKLKVNEDVIHYLYLSKLVTPLNSGILRLNYIEDIYKNISVDGLEPIITVNDFDKIGWYFDYYNGDKKIKKCEKCGVLIKKTNNKTSYCEDCAVENEKIRKKNIAYKYRK